MMPASKFASSAALLCSCAVAAALGDASSLELQRLRAAAADPLAYFDEEGPLARPREATQAPSAAVPMAHDSQYCQLQ